LSEFGESAVQAGIETSWFAFEQRGDAGSGGGQGLARRLFSTHVGCFGIEGPLSDCRAWPVPQIAGRYK